MRISTSFFAMCLIALAISCSTVTVDYDYDPKADFASLKSYSWFPVPQENIRYDLLIKQIKSAMERELHMRGYSMVSDDPDFFIALHGGIQPRMSYEDWQYVYEYYEPYWAKRRVDITKYVDQQLIVDFIDTKSKELVYRAIATAFVPEPTPEERKKTIDDAIMKIMNNFPPVQ